jgi:hypothetical protein
LLRLFFFFVPPSSSVFFVGKLVDKLPWPRINTP